MSEKAGLLHRVLAYIIDAVIANIVSLIPFIGGILGFLYFLLRDGIGDGQGIGKRLLGLQVINYSTKGRISYADSARRNLIFALPSLLIIIPVLGWVAYAIVIVAVWIVEIHLVLRDAEGRRFGDKWAGTVVVQS